MRALVDEGVDDGSAAADSADAPRRSAVLAALGVAAAVAVGVALRFVSTSALWLDEALSVNIARLPVGDLLDALRHDGHPPLYYLILHGWMKVVGEGDVAVVALSPFWVRYGTETRMYSLVMLLVLAGYLLILDAFERPRAGRLVAIAVISGLLLLTHYWTFYLLAAVVLLLALRWWRQPDDRGATVRVGLAAVAGSVLFLPWLGGVLYQARNTGTPWGEPFRPTAVLQTTLADMGGGEVTEATLY